MLIRKNRMTRQKKIPRDPTYAIFLKSKEFKDTDAEITKTNTKTYTKTKTKCIEDPTYAIFSKSGEFKDIKYDKTRPGQTRREKTLISRT